MSRITDTERGARMALDIAHPLATQLGLFGDVPGYEFWDAIEAAAAEQLHECRALREAMAQA